MGGEAEYGTGAFYHSKNVVMGRSGRLLWLLRPLVANTDILMRGLVVVLGIEKQSSLGAAGDLNYQQASGIVALVKAPNLIVGNHSRSSTDKSNLGVP